MPFSVALVFLCCSGVLGVAACAADAPRHVRAYEISAVAVSAAAAGRFRITAKGRMRTGGHTNPRLRPVGKVKGRELVLELIADPPPPGSVVALYLQPVSAEYRTTAKGVEFVRIVSETNMMRRRLPDRDRH